MRTIYSDELKSAVKNWWLSLVLGILFVLTALLLMFTPLEAYIALSIVFSICMLASGIVEVVFAISNKKILPSWGWYLAGGIIDLILGIFLICNLNFSMLVIPFLVSFWLMFRGFSAVGFSFDLQRLSSGSWGWYLAFGILAVICSICIIWYPAAGALSVVYLLSFLFLFMGVSRIMLSFDLKKLHNRQEKIRKHLDVDN